MNDTRPTVSVIIAAYHSARFLPRCLTSIESQTFRDFETILVNSSPETETAAVAAGFPTVRFVQSPVRLLPHAARNAGVTLARGSLLVFTDADCEVDRGWLAALVASYAAGHGIVGGCIDSKAVTMLSRGIHILKYAPYLRDTPAGPIPLAATGNLLVSRDVWAAAGPFDGSIFCGDALLSWRAREAGFEPWYEPKAIVVDQDEQYRRGFLVERFRRGREFGRVRAAHERWGPLRRCLAFVAAPLAASSAVAKTGRACLRGGAFAAFLATLPFQYACQLAWCTGEALGYASGTADDRGETRRTSS